MKQLTENPAMIINNHNITGNNNNLTVGNNNRIKQKIKTLKKKIPLTDLASEIRILINEIQKNPNQPESFSTIGSLQAAEMSASQNKESDVYKYLKQAGTFGLDIAKKIGIPLVVEAIKIAMED
jgi:hypothetical protein